jgi:O-antigen/teichoic acid export membrane protein
MATESGSENLSKRSFHALKWNYLGNGVNMLSQFLIGIVLARLLGPSDFGVVAIAWLMIGIGKLVSDFGFSAALVQWNNLTERDLRFVFSAQVGLGSLLALTGFLLADVMATFFHNPSAAPVIRAMALIFLIQPFGQTSSAMLARELAFKTNQLIRVASYLIGYIAVGIPCAYHGFGPWSLVAAQLVQSLLFAILAVYKSKVPMRPAFSPSSTGLFSFGSKVIGANLASWGISNLDSFIVGRMLAIADLGLYNRTMALVATPMGAATTSLQAVLFSACSRAQTNHERIKRAYLAATATIGFICLPVFITVAIVPEAVILGLYGGKWAAAIPILIPLALAMPVNALLAVVGPVLTAMDKVGLELRVQVISLVVMLPVLYVTARYSLTTLAWGVLGIYVLRWLLLVRSILKVLDARWKELFGAMLWPFLCALVAAFPTWGIDHLTIVLPSSLRLAIDMAIAALSLLLFTRLFGKPILRGFHGDYLLEDGRLPIFLRRWLKVDSV